MRTRLTLALLFLAFGISNGCALMEPTRELSQTTMKSMTPRTGGYRDTTDEETDEWDFVGKEARGSSAMEQDPDPWWQQWIMSDKARSIERNLGIE